MSAETVEWLNTNTRIGFTDKRGHVWHFKAGATNHFPGPVPIEEVQELFGWQAISSPLYVQTPLGMMPVDGRQAIVRSDTSEVLGIFKSGYVIHQYQNWLLTEVGNILDDGLAIGSAGLLRNGAQAWVSVEVPENIKTPEGVEFRPNLLACTSLDGSLSTTYKRIVTNVVCDNTLSAGLGEQGQQIKIKHSKNSVLKIAQARDALAMIHTIADDFAAEVKALCEIDVSDRAWSAFLDAHMPLVTSTGEPKTKNARTIAENQRESLVKLWNHDVRVTPWRGTAFGVLQAVNTYVHHESTVRGASRAERNMDKAIMGEFDALDQQTIATLTRAMDLVSV